MTCDIVSIQIGTVVAKHKAGQDHVISGALLQLPAKNEKIPAAEAKDKKIPRAKAETDVYAYNSPIVKQSNSFKT